MVTYKSQPKRKYALVWHQMCGRSENQMAPNHPSLSVKFWSSMSATESDQQIKEASPRRRNMMTSKCRKGWVWLNGSREASMGDLDKITNRSLSQRVSRKWEWTCKAMEIYKSKPKWKYALVWHQIHGRSNNRTISNHPSSNVQSLSSISTTESGLNIKETSPRRRSMMISKYQPNLKYMSK